MKLPKRHLNAWRLFLTAHTRIVEQIDHELRQSEQIPLNWYDVLIELYEAPDNRLRMSDLAQRVLLTRSGLTRLVDRLEKEEYIIREIDPDDRRGFYAIITGKGKQAMRAAWEVYSKSINTHFAQYISEEETVILINVFEQILKDYTDDK